MSPCLCERAAHAASGPRRCGRRPRCRTPLRNTSNPKRGRPGGAADAGRAGCAPSPASPGCDRPDHPPEARGVLAQADREIGASGEHRLDQRPSHGRGSGRAGRRRAAGGSAARRLDAGLQRPVFTAVRVEPDQPDAGSAATKAAVSSVEPSSTTSTSARADGRRGPRARRARAPLRYRPGSRRRPRARRSCVPSPGSSTRRSARAAPGSSSPPIS